MRWSRRQGWLVKSNFFFSLQYFPPTYCLFPLAPCHHILHTVLEKVSKAGIFSQFGLHLNMHAQSCPTFCNPVDYSPPDSSVHGISQQEYWGRLPFLLPGDLPNPGIELTSPISRALAGRFFTTEPPGNPTFECTTCNMMRCSIWLMSSLFRCLLIMN